MQKLKEQADILKIFEVYGHSVKKTGTGYFVQCPFHNDKQVTILGKMTIKGRNNLGYARDLPKKNLWQRVFTEGGVCLVKA